MWVKSCGLAVRSCNNFFRAASRPVPGTYLSLAQFAVPAILSFFSNGLEFSAIQEMVAVGHTSDDGADENELLHQLWILQSEIYGEFATV